MQSQVISRETRPHLRRRELLSWDLFLICSSRIHAFTFFTFTHTHIQMDNTDVAIGGGNFYIMMCCADVTAWAWTYSALNILCAALLSTLFYCLCLQWLTWSHSTCWCFLPPCLRASSVNCCAWTTTQQQQVNWKHTTWAALLLCHKLKLNELWTSVVVWIRGSGACKFTKNAKGWFHCLDTCGKDSLMPKSESHN